MQIHRLNVSLSQGCRGQIKRDHTKPFPNAVQGEPGRRLEKEYDPKVSFRDGRYYVFDGQNTVEARRACNGGKDLPIRCKVFLGLSKEGEAMLFALQTGISTCLTAGERLRANLVARNPDAIHFVRATVDTGVEFAYDGIRASWKIYCIETAYPQYASATKCAEQVVEEEENAVKWKQGVPSRWLQRETMKRIFVKVMSYEMEHSFLRNDLDWKQLHI